MCYKQAGLMQDLQARLINGGFSEVEFRILSTESAANDTDGLWRLKYAAGHPTIPVLQEMPSNLLWYKLLDGAVDHILVLDRCSRLTYQVITPWSVLHFPYVKAAILSTYEDDPCGSCAVSLEAATNLDQNNSNSTIDDLSITDNSTLDINENISIPNTATNNNTASIFEAEDTPSSAEFPYSSSSEQTQSSDIPAYFSNVTTDSNSTSVTPTTDIITTPDVEAYENDKTYDINTADIQENTVLDDIPLFDTYVQTSPDEMKATLAPLTERADGTIPVRVVMHSPHLHRLINGTITQHEYLELQTGNPDYHGHLVNDNNIVLNNSNDEQTTKRKKYKGQRRKGKLRPEVIQEETQENNYEDTKIKHHRDKGRPEKKKQKIKNDEQLVSEETSTAATMIPLQDPIAAQPVHKDTGEDNTEVASPEIPQEIQEHYDYSNMPNFISKNFHKPLKVTEEASVVSGAVTESSSNAGEEVQIEENEHRDTMHNPPTNETRVSGIISKDMTSDKQIIKATEKLKDHKKYKPNAGQHLPQKGTAESENDLMGLKAPAVNVSIVRNSTSPQDAETSNSDQQYQKQKAQSHDTNILRNPHTLEVDTDLNVIDSEEHMKYKPNKAGKETDAMQGIGSIENHPTLRLSNEDDESKKQIIQHYSQLLKWIHYSLPEKRD